MRLEQRQRTPASGWLSTQHFEVMRAPQLVLLFGDAVCLHDGSLLAYVKKHYSGAHLLGCSTAGEILGEQTMLAGFYSHSEISPFYPADRSELHNQTMTITSLKEF
jgi:hypothetical protein